MSLSENRCPLFRDMRQPTRRPMQGDAPCARKPGCRIPGNVLSFAPINNVQGRRRWVLGSANENNVSSAGAETASAATPIPTQIVSNGEYLPPPQSETQKRVERRIFELADENSKRLGLNRRQFLQTGCGMAAAFLAMNDIYGGGRVPGRDRRGARAGADAAPAPRASPDSSSSTCRPISCATTSTNAGVLAPRQVRRRALEPEAEGSDSLAGTVQVPELRQGGLLRQRHQHGAA